MRRGYAPEYRDALLHLRIERERRGLSKRELAERIGKSPSYVNQVELGAHELSLMEFVTYAAALAPDKPASSFLPRPPAPAPREASLHRLPEVGRLVPGPVRGDHLITIDDLRDGLGEAAVGAIDDHALANCVERVAQAAASLLAALPVREADLEDQLDELQRYRRLMLGLVALLAERLGPVDEKKALRERIEEALARDWDPIIRSLLQHGAAADGPDGPVGLVEELAAIARFAARVDAVAEAQDRARDAARMASAAASSERLAAVGTPANAGSLGSASPSAEHSTPQQALTEALLTAYEVATGQLPRLSRIAPERADAGAPTGPAIRFMDSVYARFAARAERELRLEATPALDRYLHPGKETLVNRIKRYQEARYTAVAAALLHTRPHTSIEDLKRAVRDRYGKAPGENLLRRVFAAASEQRANR